MYIVVSLPIDLDWLIGPVIDSMINGSLCAFNSLGKEESHGLWLEEALKNQYKWIYIQKQRTKRSVQDRVLISRSNSSYCSRLRMTDQSREHSYILLDG